MKRFRSALAIVALVAVAVTPASARTARQDHAPLGEISIDVRDANAPVAPTAPQLTAARALRRATPDVVLQWNERFGTPKTILRHGAPLAAQDPRVWLRANASLFGWRPADVDALTTEKTLRLPDGGATVVLLHQTFGGLHGGSFGGSIVAGLDARGNLLSIRANVTRGTALAAGRRIDAAAALLAASAGAVSPVSLGVRNGWSFFDGPGPVAHFARPAAFPTGTAPARPIWDVFYAERTDSVWRTAVDALTGDVLYRVQTVRHEAPEGRVFRNYPGAPRGGAHEMVSFAGDKNASPAGWLTVAEGGPSIPTTIGNNANVSTHWFLGPAPDGPGQLRPIAPDGIFDEPFTDSWNKTECGRVSQVPNQRVNALPTFALDALPAAVNLFYHFNVVHDYWNSLGFTPEAGAMQTSNFGGGGLGGDPLIGLVQAGAANPEFGRNNAYMLSTPDGVPSYSGYFVDEPAAGEPLPKCIDIDFDAQTIYHEYAHGVTNRYVGAEYGNLDGAQGGAMGESWGDFYAIHYLHEAGLEKRTSLFMYDVGGIDSTLRNWSMAESPVHYGDFDYDGPSVHSNGEIWNGLLWDMRGSMGRARAGGTRLAAQLIADAMPLSGPMPSMLDMRDAILGADLARGGRNQSLLWSVFARHGMGHTAGTSGTDDPRPKAGFTHKDAKQNGRVAVRVIDPVSGRPVQGAEVLMGQMETVTTLAGVTNAAGSLSMLLAAGPHRITVRGKAFGSRTVTVRSVASRVTKADLRLSPNYASASVGAAIAKTSGDAASAAAAIDDSLGTSTTLPKQNDSAIVVRLGGDAPVEISEVRLAASLHAARDALKDWKMLSSLDGKTFKPLVAGRLGPIARWGSALSAGDYESVRPRPTKARFLKLVALSSRTETPDEIRVAEIQVFGRGAAFDIRQTRTVFDDTGTVAVAAGAAGQNGPTPTELVMVANCSFPPASQGLDSWVTELPGAFAAGGSITVAYTPAAGGDLADMDVYFLDETCARIDALATGQPTETGVIPGGTKYVVASLWFGSPGTIDLHATAPAARVTKLASKRR